MQVFALVLLAVASVSAKGSGPYLPSGWRPQGPAFYLPSEVKTSSESPKEIVLEGSEASGSDFLREYGPPVAQEVSQNLINQGLPDVTIEQTFGAAKFEIKNEAAAQPIVSVTEALIEQLSEAVTESLAIEEKSTVSEPLAEIEKAVETSQTTVSDDVEATKVELLQLENEASSEGSTESVQLSVNSVATQVASEESQSTPADVEVSQVTLIVENVSEQVSQESANQEATTQQEQQQVSQTETTEQSEVSLSGSQLESGVSLLQVQNIPDIIASLENEEKVQEAEVSQAVVSEVSGAGALEQAPEGFLEYGPPGFAEYGPPKGDLNQEEKQADQSFEYNETRRRRFSPKFRHTKKQ